MSATSEQLGGLQAEYRRYTLATTIRNAKVACMVVIVLMPAGYLLDYFVYRAYCGHFLKLRFLGSACAVVVLLGLKHSGWPVWFSRVLSAGWYLIPAAFISWMIYTTEGFASSYYAGLNLVILAVSSVIQATVIES